MSSATKTKRDKLPRDFNALNALWPLRPIGDDVDLDNATDIVNCLAILDQRTRDQDDYLESLSVLIEDYENKHYQIDTSKLDPIGNLKFLMEQHDMSPGDLGRILGQRELGYAIIRGDRELSKNHIRKLCAQFKVGAGVFLKP